MEDFLSLFCVNDFRMELNTIKPLFSVLDRRGLTISRNSRDDKSRGETLHFVAVAHPDLALIPDSSEESAAL